MIGLGVRVPLPGPRGWYIVQRTLSTDNVLCRPTCDVHVDAYTVRLLRRPLTVVLHLRYVQNTFNYVFNRSTLLTTYNINNSLVVTVLDTYEYGRFAAAPAHQAPATRTRRRSASGMCCLASPMTGASARSCAHWLSGIRGDALTLR